MAEKKRKKVSVACIYCRRSHMICDEKRPCSRCIKREIGHLCHDEPVKKVKQETANNTDASSISPIGSNHIIDPQQHVIERNIPDNSISVNPLPTSNISQPPQPTQQEQLIENQNTPGMIGTAIPRNKSILSQLHSFSNNPMFYSEHANSEFSSLNEFLSMIDDPEMINSASHNISSNRNSYSDLQTALLYNNNETTSNSAANFNSLFASSNIQNHNIVSNDNDSDNNNNNNNSNNTDSNKNVAKIKQHQHHQVSNSITNLTNLVNMNNYQQNNNISHQQQNNSSQRQERIPTSSDEQATISDSAREKFFLTAADPSTEISPEERLKQVIKAKLDAGLLQPYNYAQGYTRLQTYMDNYMNAQSRQRILKPLLVFRPAFRAIARTLKDVDLVLVEESFERMLLDYDRVFTSMAIPACLWRRTGEIYRGNKEFAQLVEISDVELLKDGKLAIYELMSEESAVNFWEKYGAIAFDKGQKAVLTSCNLRTKDGRKRKNCCFSFTIRRDRYNIPSCIVGNFIPIDNN